MVNGLFRLFFRHQHTSSQFIQIQIDTILSNVAFEAQISLVLICTFLTYKWDGLLLLLLFLIYI